jgi:hypothetical protein
LNYSKRIEKLDNLRKSVSSFTDDLERASVGVIDTLDRDLEFWENCKTRQRYDDYRDDLKLQIDIGDDALGDLIDSITKRINFIKEEMAAECRQFGGLAAISDYDDLESKRSALYSADIDSSVREKLLFDLESNAALLKIYI